MRFLSIYKSPERSTPPTPEEMCNMGKMIEEWMQSGKLLATEGCMPSSLGARVRLENGKHSVSDGPFTESKEVVGGFAILDAPSKEAAIGYVKEFLDVVGTGECELRQLYDANNAPQDLQQKLETVKAR
ncbi:MAG TPA: YciI family protein [Terracidiphilus sp.]